MPVPSANDIARLRGTRHTTEVILNAVPLVSLATAQVNQTEFTYPLGALTVDNTSADWLTRVKVGHLLAIGSTPGASDITWGVVRKSVTATTLYLDGKSQGDPGYARNIAAALADNAYITVYKYRPPWGLLSSIRRGRFYKKFDVAYSDQGLKPAPIVRLGRWRQAWIGGGGTAQVAFSATGVPWGSATVAAYEWFIDGLTLVSGTLADPNITVEGAPGFYELTCTITDSRGKITTAYRYLWINTTDRTSSHSPFSYRHRCRIVSDQQDVRGRKIALEVDGNFSPAEMFPGMAFLLSETPRYDGLALENPDLVPHTFAGYLSEKAVNTSYKARTTTLQLHGPLALANQVTTVTQQMVEKNTPRNWTQVSPLLSNPVGALWYTASHHAPYLIEGHDLTFDAYFLTLRRKSFTFTSDNIGGQIEDLAEMISGVIGARSDGALRVVRNPLYLSNDDRNALTTRWTWEPGDMIGSLEYPFSYRQNIGQVYAYAFSYNGGRESKAYGALAPGATKAQGGDVVSMTPVIVTHDEGQLRVMEIAGHHLALLNNPTTQISVQADRNLDIAEPVDIDEWHVLSVAAAYDPEGSGWGLSAAQPGRMIPVRVTRAWSSSGQTVKRVTITWQMETYGLKGIAVEIARGGGGSAPGAPGSPTPDDDVIIDDPYEPKPPRPEDDDTLEKVRFIVGINAAGVLARSFSFLEQTVGWARLGGFSGAARDLALDYFSDYFAAPPDPDVGAWLITDQGDTLRIYYTAVLQRTTLPPSWALQATLAAANGYAGKSRIVSSRDENDLAIMVTKDRTGVRFSRTTNGTSWSALAYIGTNVTDTQHDGEDIGAAVYDEMQCVIAPDGTTGSDGKLNYFLYHAPTKSSSFSKVASHPTDFRCVLGSLFLRSTTECIVALEKLASPAPPSALGTVTFDGGGYASYTLSVNAVVGSSGNPGNAARVTRNLASGANIEAISVEVDLGANYILHSVQFDRAFTMPSSVDDLHLRSKFTALDAYDNVVGEVARLDCESSSPSGCSITAAPPQTWNTLSATADEMNVTEPVRSVLVYSEVTWGADAGGFLDCWIDNIVISASLIEYPRERKLYRVNPATGVWTDITPGGGELPRYAYALAGDRATATDLSLVGHDIDNYAYLLDSANSGTSWSRVARSVFRGVRRGGSTLLLFGPGGLAVSFDEGQTVYTRFGDWSATIGDRDVKLLTGVL